MSEPYGYERQFDNETPPRKSSGCLKGCLIALVILVLLAVAVVGVVIWFVRDIAKGITRDPQEVVQQLHDRYPSAKIPDGYEGVIGMHIKLFIDMHMIVLAKDNAEVNEAGNVLSGDSIMLFSMNVPGAKEEDFEKGFQPMHQGAEVVEKRPYTVHAGEYEFEGFKQTVQQRVHGERKTMSQILVPLGASSFLVMQGASDKVDEEALSEFLSSIAKDCPTANKVGDTEEDKKKGKQGDKEKKNKGENEKKDKEKPGS